MAKSPRKTKIAWVASIVDGWLYFEDARQAQLDTDLFFDLMGDGYTRAVRLVSLASNWQSREWIAGVGTMNFAIHVEMTLRLEERSGRMYWYAYRRVGGILFKRYVGSNDQITTKRLVEVAQKFPG